MRYRVLIKRNADGLERWTDWHDPYGDDADNPGSIIFSWRENNFSCDCNRQDAFDRAGGASEDELDDDGQCGHDRYDVLRIETDDGRAADEENGRWVTK